MPMNCPIQIVVWLPLVNTLVYSKLACMLTSTDARYMYSILHWFTASSPKQELDQFLTTSRYMYKCQRQPSIWQLEEWLLCLMLQYHTLVEVHIHLYIQE